MPAPRKRKRSIKDKKRKRHPRNYWSNLNNLRKELIEFWQSIEVPIQINENPPIPNETLLNYDRHDLRHAIHSLG